VIRYKIEYSVEEDERVTAWVFTPERRKRSTPSNFVVVHDAILRGKMNLRCRRRP
jgi:hypothetical protein